MSVGFLTALILLTTVNAEDNSTYQGYRSCKGKVPFPKRGTDLPAWCTSMRIDVGSCMSKKLKIDDNGSIASRGNVLLSALKQDPDPELLSDVKLYHYGCLYNDWRDFFDQDCYKKMVKDCVDGDKSCYYNPCPTGSASDGPSKLKDSGNTWKLMPLLKSDSHVHFALHIHIAFVLTVAVLKMNFTI